MLLLANKKGQQESNMLIWIVVGIIAAIIVVLFFTKGFGIFDNLFGQAPQTLEAATQACKLVASPETRTSFCDQWRNVDVGGEEQEVNCQYPAIFSKLELAVDISCPYLNGSSQSVDYEGKGREYCGILFKNGNVNEKTKVNDVRCSTLKCEELSGRLVAKSTIPDTKACDQQDNGYTKEILKFFSDSDGNVCCVKG